MYRAVPVAGDCEVVTPVPLSAAQSRFALRVSKKRRTTQATANAMPPASPAAAPASATVLSPNLKTKSEPMCTPDIVLPTPAHVAPSVTPALPLVDPLFSAMLSSMPPSLNLPFDALLMSQEDDILSSTVADMGPSLADSGHTQADSLFASLSPLLTSSLRSPPVMPELPFGFPSTVSTDEALPEPSSVVPTATQPHHLLAAHQSPDLPMAVSPPLTVRRCGCGCWKTAASRGHVAPYSSAPVGVLAADARTDPASLLRSRLANAGLDSIPGCKWSLRVCLFDDFMPLGEHQSLSSLSAGMSNYHFKDVFIHLSSPTAPPSIDAPCPNDGVVFPVCP